MTDFWTRDDSSPDPLPASPWAPTAPSRSPAPPPTPVAAPTPPGADRSSRRGPIAMVLGVSLLSASIAAGAVAFALAPSLAPTPTPAPAASAAAAGSTAPTGQLTGSGSSTTTTTDPVVSVAEQVSPAVVTITSEVQSSRNSGPFSVPGSGVGSGVIFRSDGWILTNHHVIEGATSLTVTLKDGRELAAEVVEQDASKDLAVIKVDATDLPAATIGSSAELQVGQLVIAIGSPLGQFTDSVTSGILSAIGRTIEVPDEQTRRVVQLKDLLQTDAAINPGNSGGPLLDGQGEVIGINTAVASSANGIGFAIPIDTAASIIAKAIGVSAS